MIEKSSFSRRLVIAFIAVSVGIVVAGAWIYKIQEALIKDRVRSELQTIAQLKVDRISELRTVLYNDAALLMENPFLAEGVEAYFSRQKAKNAKQILSQFVSLQKHQHYYDILLVDVDGKLRLSLNGRIGSLHAQAMATMNDAYRDRRPLLTDLHAGPDDLVPHLDLITPFFRQSGAGSEPIGAIILQTDARQSLYPQVEFWPTPSKTAETLLVRRDGDDVLFLNDLRFGKNAALTKRIPLTRTNVPAVAAALGREGFFQGVDYRGHPVIAVLETVPNSNWHMVAKIDTDDAMAQWHKESALILSLILLLLVIAAMIVGVLWQRINKAHYRALQRAHQELEARVRERTAELTQTNELLETMFSSIHLSVVFLDRDFNFIRVNKKYADSCGYPIEYFTGKNHFALYPHAENEVIFRRVVETGEPVTYFAKPFEFPDHPEWGVTYWNWTLKPFKGADGKVTGLLFTLLDVTESKQAELALRESEERYRNLVESIPDGITVTVDRRFVYVNPAGVRIFGARSAEELVGRSPMDFLTPDQQAAAAERLDTFEEGQAIPSREFDIKGLDGRLNRVESRGIPIIYQGRQALFGVFQDVSERRLLEAKLRDASAYARGLIEANLDALVTISPEGKITDVNRATEVVTGYSREHLIGSDFSSYFTEPQKAVDGYRQVLTHGVVRDYPLTIRHTSGRTTDVLYNAIVHRMDESEAPGVFAAARDITERKKAEQDLRTLNRSLEVRAEQLRRLTADLIRAEEAERRRLTQLLHDHLQQLLVAAKLRLSAVLPTLSADGARKSITEVQELLGQSIDASRSLTAEISPQILYDAGLPPALEWLSRWMEEKHSLIVDLDADPAADPPNQETRVLLFRGVRELLFNVTKHAGVNHARVTLRRLDDGAIRLLVADEGNGFDPVERLIPGSSGFGLFSIRERMELMGGRLEIDSAVGQGTRVSLIIPPGREKQSSYSPFPVERRKAVREQAAVFDGRPRIRVLLADDHVIVRQGLSSLLSSQPDMEIVGEAANGQMAVNLTHELLPDVVVMDINMPVMDGIEATRAIASRLPQIKVIGLSVHTKQDMEIRMREAGAVLFLDKSGPGEDLADAIRSCMAKNR